MVALEEAAVEEYVMEKQDFNRSNLTSAELAIHIVDTLADHGLIDKTRFQEAVDSVKWELDAQQGIGRIVLKGP